MAACLLACHSEAPPVKEWWAALQRADKQQGQHWLVGELSVRAGREGGTEHTGE